MRNRFSNAPVVRRLTSLLLLALPILVLALNAAPDCTGQNCRFW